MTKKVCLVLILALIFVGVTGCFGPPCRFEGYVIDFVTKKPIPNAKSTCCYIPILCDENGYFNFVLWGTLAYPSSSLNNTKAKGYGKLYESWDIESGQINYVPINAPNSVFGHVELNGETDIRLLMEGETYSAVAELNEAGEFTFYDVPTEEFLQIYVLKGDLKSTHYHGAFVSEEGNCIYEVIDDWCFQFEEEDVSN